MATAAAYIRTDPEGSLPSIQEQRDSIIAYAEEQSHELVTAYEDPEAPGKLLYHKPALKAAIDNIKEHEDWEVLIVAEPRIVSDDETALHELVHKLFLYKNRLESPACSWEDFFEAMQSYRRQMSKR